MTFYLIGMACFCTFNQYVSMPLSWVSTARLTVYDPVIYRMNILTGLEWPALEKAFVFVLHHSNAAYFTFSMLYNFLVIWVILAASSEICHARWTMWDNLFIRFAIGGLIGFSLYYVLPAIGPAPFFQAQFPYALPPAASVASSAVPFADGGANPRNAMPSLHATWSILCFLALRRSPPWHRGLALVYVVITFVTTIGAGLHYALDWVVALPLVLLIRGLTAASPGLWLRCSAILAGAALLAVWCAVIRMAPLSLGYPVFIQLLALVTVVIPVALERRLAGARLAGSDVVSEPVPASG